MISISDGIFYILIECCDQDSMHLIVSWWRTFYDITDNLFEFWSKGKMWPSRPANIHEEFAYGILTSFFDWKLRTMTGLLQTLCYNMFCRSRKGAKHANGWSFEERNSTQGGAVHLWIYCRSWWECGVSYQVVHGNVGHQINDVCVCVYCELVCSVRFS